LHPILHPLASVEREKERERKREGGGLKVYIFYLSIKDIQEINNKHNHA